MSDSGVEMRPKARFLSSSLVSKDDPESPRTPREIKNLPARIRRPSIVAQAQIYVALKPQTFEDYYYRYICFRQLFEDSPPEEVSQPKVVPAQDVNLLDQKMNKNNEQNPGLLPALSDMKNSQARTSANLQGNC